MAVTSESEFIFIGRGDESFLENYSYELSDDPEGRGGKVFMALEILNNQAEAEDIGEAIFSNFRQKFYEDLGGDPFERFEDALKDANRTIETLKEEKVSRFIGNLNVALGAVVDGTLYLSTAGEAEAYLVRRKFVSVISEGLTDEKKKDLFLNVANGTLEPGDRLVFSSSRLLRYITKGELGKIFSETGPRHIGEALAELQDFIMTEILGRASVIGVLIKEAARASELQTSETYEETAVAGFLKKFIPKSAFLSKFSLRDKLPWLARFGQRIREKLPSSSALPKMHLRQGMSKERILVVLITLLVVLIGGIFWLRTRGDQKRLIQEYQAKLNHARELMNDASTVGQFDKPKAAELLGGAEEQSLEVLNSGVLRSDAVKTLDDIQLQKDGLDDVKRVTQPTLLADFSQKRATVSALGLLHLKDRLYGFEYNALYEIILDALQDALPITDVETVILGTDLPDRNQLLFLTKTGKMISFGSGQFLPMTTKDGIWKKGIDMKTYNDRIYILDPERNQIWRYNRERDTFSAGEAYSQDADLKNAVSLAIDSSVYVLHADGFITQLYQGKKQTYPIRRAPLSALTSPTKMFTGADLPYLYILEPSKQRVLLFRKDPQNGGAQYQTQYVFENTGVLRDLVVADNRLYVMDDKKVYFVNLSGL